MSGQTRTSTSGALTEAEEAVTPIEGAETVVKDEAEDESRTNKKPRSRQLHVSQPSKSPAMVPMTLSSPHPLTIRSRTLRAWL